MTPVGRLPVLAGEAVSTTVHAGRHVHPEDEQVDELVEHLRGDDDAPPGVLSTFAVTSEVIAPAPARSSQEADVSNIAERHLWVEASDETTLPRRLHCAAIVVLADVLDGV